MNGRYHQCDAECPARATNRYILHTGLELYACSHHAREFAAAGIGDYVLVHEVEGQPRETVPAPSPADVYRR